MAGEGKKISDDDSDVDVEGIDLEDDNDNDQIDDDDDTDNNLLTEGVIQDVDDTAANELESIEQNEIEEARRERLELLKAAENNSNVLKSPQKQGPVSNQGDRLEYLLAQSDVFAQFLAGSVAATGGKKNKKSGSRGKTDRMTEEEEDALLLKSAQSKRHTVVRLDKQPGILSPQCKMHPYQLEGLNWMIKLHDHGINGILADGTSLKPKPSSVSLSTLNLFFRERNGIREDSSDDFFTSVPTRKPRCPWSSLNFSTKICRWKLGT
jgi:SNF2 family DNA or RNA helicase